MTEERALSVSEAMGQARVALESVRVRVMGEVSEFSDKPGYKAAYFTLSDAGAAMSCLMWRDVYEASGVQLRPGMLVEVTGQFSAYVPKGRMQFVVRRLAAAGEGALRMQVAEIARRLQAEGLLAETRKRSLPPLPARIALVTSPRGKAVHDVLRTLKRRYPLAEVLLAGVPVEGDDAPARLIEGLRVAADSAPDVILLVRGGGSYEDLMPFNDEGLARAIAASPVPIVTGIGHEPDNSIADLVADLRASTPTAAAEAVAPSVEELAALLARDRRALGRALQARTQDAAHRVTRLAGRPVFRDASAVLGSAAQGLDFLRLRLERALPDRMRRDAERVDLMKRRLAGLGASVTAGATRALALQASRLEDLSPLAVLARGYSVAFDAGSRAVISRVDQVRAGSALFVRVSDGAIDCVVSGIRKGEAS